MTTVFIRKLSGSLLLLCAALFAAPHSSFGQFSGTYDFTGTVGNVASFNYNGTAIANLSVGPLTKVGVTTSSSTNNSRASGWATGSPDGAATPGGSIDTGK